MNDKYDITQISGYESMTIEEQNYFERTGDDIIAQIELIASKHNSTSEMYSDDLDRYINSINNFKNEYIVEGAILSCSMRTTQTQYIETLRGEIIYSKPLYGNSFPSRLIIPDERQEKINGIIPANVTDSDGGLYGDIICKKKPNIISFGNCKYIKKYSKIEDIIKKVYTNFYYLSKDMKKLENDIVCAIRAGKGTCYCLMCLNKKWDNFPNNFDYIHGNFKYEIEQAQSNALNVSDRKMSCMRFNGKEGINMLSTLFCMRGGIITAKNSGQVVSVTCVSDRLIELLKKYETGQDLAGNGLPQGEPALATYHGQSDNPNIHTIGWGHAMSSNNDGECIFEDDNGNKVTMNLYNIGSTITYDQAEQLLMHDISIREAQINQELENRNISNKVDQQFYDALFLLYYQTGSIFSDRDFSAFLDATNFDSISNAQEIKEQFGEYTNGLELGTMRRRADELDVILYGDYERDYDETRYGDIWRKKTFPDSTTSGY